MLLNWLIVFVSGTVCSEADKEHSGMIYINPKTKLYLGRYTLIVYSLYLKSYHCYVASRN